MQSVTLRAKKYAWVRIVNPDPIRILDMRWRYGDHVQVMPGGAFHTLTAPAPVDRDKRVLAMYRPPAAPSSCEDAPPDALVLLTLDDLRLLADGFASFPETYDPAVMRWMRCPEGRADIRHGETSGVPRPRVVPARFPMTTHVVPTLIPYREGVEARFTHRDMERQTIRPGGTLTAFAFEDGPSGGPIRVRYRADPEGHADQCETGAWFYIGAFDFLRMKYEAARIAELEAIERSFIRRLLTQVR